MSAIRNSAHPAAIGRLVIVLASVGEKPIFSEAPDPLFFLP